jgi:hypothetical protein
MTERTPCIHATEVVRGVKLQLTNGYYLHFDQMARLLRFVQQHPSAGRHSQQALAAGSGLTARQVESLASVMVRLGLLQPRSYRLSPFGSLVARHDPFLDDLGTLWVFHYHLASDAGVLVWSHLTNCLLPLGRAVTTLDARDSIQPLLAGYTSYASQKKLMQEIHSFFNAYTDQAFAQLNYVRPVEGNAYALTDSPARVPPAALLATLLLYRDRFQPGASGLEVPVACTAPFSPGRLMHQTEAQVRGLLDSLHEGGGLTVEAKANLDQVRFHHGQVWVDAMQAHYEVERA